MPEHAASIVTSPKSTTHDMIAIRTEKVMKKIAAAIPLNPLTAAQINA
jgi:hypothetical protein